MNKKTITESKGVELYKKLLNLFGAYCDQYPCTSVDGLFEILVKKGIKALPSDKRATDILTNILRPGRDRTIAVVVHAILNTRFGDLCTELKPITKAGRRDEVAFWIVDGVVTDKVIDLLNFKDTKGQGYWGDAKGEKVLLLDTEVKEALKNDVKQTYKKDKTKDIDIDQSALKGEEKPDAKAKDLAVKMNVEPVDFKKPVPVVTRTVLKDRKVNEREWTHTIDLSSISSFVEDETNAPEEIAKKARELLYIEARKLGDENLQNELESIADNFDTVTSVEDLDEAWNELYDWGDSNSIFVQHISESKLLHLNPKRTTKEPSFKAILHNFHSVILPEGSLEPEGQRIEIEAVNEEDAEKKIKEQYGEMTKIMHLELCEQGTLSTSNLYDIMKDVKEDFEEEHGLGKGREDKQVAKQFHEIRQGQEFESNGVLYQKVSKVSAKNEGTGAEVDFYEDEKCLVDESKITEETKLEQQLKIGIEIEKEHTDDPEEAAKIALDHLKERPDYYTKLKKMEASPVTNEGSDVTATLKCRWCKKKTEVHGQLSGTREVPQFCSACHRKTIHDVMVEGVKEEVDKSKLKVVARGFEKKEEADAVAKTKQGQVVQDDNEKEKFMVIVKDEKAF